MAEEIKKRPAQHQAEQPGSKKQMHPRPQAIREDYHGANNLRDKIAIITGGDSGIGRNPLKLRPVMCFWRVKMRHTLQDKYYIPMGALLRMAEKTSESLINFLKRRNHMLNILTQKLKKYGLVAFYSMITCLLVNTTSYATQIKEVKPVITDTNITSTVKSELNKDPILKKYNLDVETKNHIVQLKGQVDTEKQAEKSVAIASSIEGVRDVNTRDLKIKDSKTPIADSYITSKIYGKLIRDKIFSDYNVALTRISIETKNGVVYLSGTVDSDSLNKRIVELAKETDGVKKVVDDLHISR